MAKTQEEWNDDPIAKELFDDEGPKDITDEGSDRDVNKDDDSNVASEQNKEDDNMSNNNNNQEMTEEKAFADVDWDGVKNGAKRGLKEVGKAAVGVGVTAAGTYLGMRAYDKWARGEAEAADVDDDVVDFEDAQAQ